MPTAEGNCVTRLNANKAGPANCPYQILVFNIGLIIRIFIIDPSTIHIGNRIEEAKQGGKHVMKSPPHGRKMINIANVQDGPHEDHEKSAQRNEQVTDSLPALERNTQDPDPDRNPLKKA